MFVARDKDGTLSFFVLKPIRYNTFWGEADDSPSMQDSCTLPKRLFKELTWDDEPLYVDLVPNKPFKFKLSEETKARIEQDSGKTIEEIRKTPLKDLLKK